MRSAPDIKKKKERDILKMMKDLVPFYAPEWNAAADKGVGNALLTIFSTMAEAVVQRLNRVPDKNLVAFLDMLKAGLTPPQPARSPVTFLLSEGAMDHVLIPEGTQTAAGDVVFETEKPFLASPAKLAAAFCVHDDEIHEAPPNFPDGKNQAPFALYSGENLQEHVLYLGDTNLFNFRKGTISITFSPPILSPTQLKWEYWGMDDQDTGQWLPLKATTNVNKVLLTKESARESILRKIGDVESLWVRCSAQNGRSYPPVDRIAVKVEGPLAADMAFYNDTPINLDEPFYPFGKNPRLLDTFYLASPEFFSKPKANIQLVFSLEDEVNQSDDLILSWEYWNGKSWQVVKEVRCREMLKKDYWNPILKNATNLKKGDYGIFFTCPEDITPTVVNGQKNFWIRSRIVNGGFGKEELSLKDNGGSYVIIRDLKGIKPPKVEQLVIQTDNIENVPCDAIKVTPGKDNDNQDILNVSIANQKCFSWEEHLHDLSNKISASCKCELGPQSWIPQWCFTSSNLELRDVSEACRIPGKYFDPFPAILDPKPSLYLGFDKKIEGGPVSAFFDIMEQEAQESTRIEWEYHAGSGNEGSPQWNRLVAQDNTYGLTRSGTMEFAFPTDFTPASRFGKELYWVRAFPTQTELTQPYPIIRGIHLNTSWLIQAETVRDELLGSSTGEADSGGDSFPSGQTFTLSRSPVISAEVWVDEAATISERERSSLKEKGPGGWEETWDESGSITNFWVKWSSTQDLLWASNKDRCYELDTSAGRVWFGNGVHGSIPPAGRDNVKATYKVGGGSRGNVAANQITSLKTSIAFVDRVLNPISAGGASDAEDFASAIDRGTHAARNRGRAITEEDYEFLTREASPAIAKAKCIPGMDNNYNTKAGWVSVIIMPSSQDEMPIPSLQLKSLVEQHLARSCPEVIRDRLFVAGPRYCRVSVNAVLKTKTLEAIPSVEMEAHSKIKSFLHPLTGGDKGTGWDFGRMPYYSDFYAILEKVGGVDYVESLSVELCLMVGGQEKGKTTLPPDESWKIPFEVYDYDIVSSGTHTIHAG